jgi:hypothetical protein
MAGGYVVTGFGTTYFGGNRDPGPFDLDAAKNDVWEAQISHVRGVFAPLAWWKLAPHDELLSCPTPRGADGKERNQTVPPAVTYWCLAEPGQQYVVYARGLKEPVTLALGGGQTALARTLIDPRTGVRQALGVVVAREQFEFRPPDQEDWVVLLERTGR